MSLTTSSSRVMRSSACGSSTTSRRRRSDSARARAIVACRSGFRAPRGSSGHLLQGGCEFAAAPFARREVGEATLGRVALVGVAFSRARDAKRIASHSARTAAWSSSPYSRVRSCHG